MDPRQFLERAIVSTYDFLMDRLGQRLVPDAVPPSRQTPVPSMRDIPFGPYQPLINEAERVKDELNEQTRRKEQFIREQLGR